MPESCPKCHRKGTWSAKWQSCSGCGFKVGQDAVERALAKPTPKKKKPKNTWGKRNGSVTDDSGKRDGPVTPEPGLPCPACGQRVPYPSAAAKQKAWRQKKRQRTKGVA